MFEGSGCGGVKGAETRIIPFSTMVSLGTSRQSLLLRAQVWFRKFPAVSEILFDEKSDLLNVRCPCLADVGSGLECGPFHICCAASYCVV